MSDPQKVLVVEDSRVQAKIISEHIRDRTPYDTIVTHTLAETREVMTAQGDAIFVAILDLNLPDDPGGEIVALARRLGVPSVVMTSTFSEEVRQSLLAQNVVDYFLKTMAEITNMERLIERLHKNLAVRALAVDDSKAFRQYMVSLLKNLNFQTMEAADGQEALEILKSDPGISLCITDYHMPRLDGFGLIEEIRVTRPKDKLAIIGVSGVGGGQTARFLKAGANDFLTKPIQVEELTCRVNQQMEMLDIIQTCKALTEKHGG